MLNTLNLEIVKRARPTSVFNFGEASIGNMFLTGYVLCPEDFTYTPMAYLRPYDELSPTLTCLPPVHHSPPA